MSKILAGLIVLLSNVAFAEEVVEVTETVTKAGPSDSVYFGLAGAFAIALAALGGALGQGKVASAAMEGIGRNPNATDKMQTPMILGLVFIETLVLFGFVIAFLLISK